MKKRNCIGLVICLALLAGSHVSAQAPQAKPRLNVLFIVADDLNTALGCYSHPLVKTPNLDRLAARGVRFERAYCQYPLCNPSRTSLLSGLRPERTQTYDNQTTPKTHLKDAVFLPEYFRNQGYFTARVGKIAHNRFGFERDINWHVSISQPWFPAGVRPTKEEVERARIEWDQCPTRLLPRLEVMWEATDTRDEDEPDGRTAREIVRLMEEDKGEPFFIAAGFLLPHVPYIAPRKYFDLYPLDKIRLPEAPADDRNDIPAPALMRVEDFERLSNEEKRQVVRAYYASISMMDAQVGVLLDALERLKLAENTIVVFFGDHGYHLGEHGGLYTKQTLFEEATRAPLIVAGPGAKRGAVSPRLVELVDLYPTLAEACVLPPPQRLDGKSFVPLLKNPAQKWKQAVYTEQRRGGRNASAVVWGRSVRTETHRYTEWSSGEAELYDLRRDPREFTNLAQDQKQAKTIAEMQRLLRQGWRTPLPAKARAQ